MSVLTPPKRRIVKPPRWRWRKRLIAPRWHGLADHLVAGIILWDLNPSVFPGPRASVFDAGQGTGRPSIEATRYGAGLRFVGQESGFYKTGFEPLAGLESWTIFGAWIADDNFTGGDTPLLGWGRWQPEQTLLNRLESSTQVRCIATLSGSRADLTIPHNFTNGEYGSLLWRLDRGTLQGAPNGEWDASTDTGSGTQTGSALDFFGTGESGALATSHKNLSRGTPLCAYAFDVALPDHVARELHRDPFGLFRQTARVQIRVESAPNLEPDDLRSETRLDATDVADALLEPEDLRSETRLENISVPLEPEDLRSATRLQNITTPLVPDDLRSATRLDATVPSLAPFDLRSSTRLDSIALRRPIDSGAQDEVDKSSGVAVTHVMEIHYEQAGTDKVLRLTTANQPIDVSVEGSEKTFTATPTNVLRLGTIEVTSDMAAQGVELTLGGVDRTFISLVMADDVHFRGRLVKLWRVYMDPDTGEVSAVVPSSENGWLFHINDTIEFEEDWGGIGEPGTVTVTTRIVSRLAVLQQPNGVSPTVESHNEMLARAGVLGTGDTLDGFFRRLPNLIGRRIRWGETYEDLE